MEEISLEGRVYEIYSYDELNAMSITELGSIALDLDIELSNENYNNSIELLKSIQEKYQLIYSNILGRRKEITDFHEGGFEKVQEFLNINLGKENLDNAIKVPAKINLYEDISIDIEDDYKISITENTGTTVCLVGGSGHLDLVGIFKIRKYNNEFYLTVSNFALRMPELKTSNFSLLLFNREVSGKIVKKYYGENVSLESVNYIKVPVNIDIQKLEETNMTLCIDFGSSNTTAGCFVDDYYVQKKPTNDIKNKNVILNKINLVKFLDESEGKRVFKEIFPTIVYTENCKNSEDIEFLFGYDAKNRIRQNDYFPKASSFYEIKKWVSLPAAIEKIYDEEGNIVELSRDFIIKEYLMYVIKRAESQFKCKFKKLHISAPVKLKSQFLERLKNIIVEYDIILKDSFDEGIAVLYNTIADKMESGKFNNDEEYHALIIDCGGGTTELCSCSFRISEEDITRKIEIVTKFEDGDANFGGNNITFRIFQYLKIAFANIYAKNSIPTIDQLIPIESDDIFRMVDSEGVQALYSKFEQEYKEAENIIPTKYKEYENRYISEYNMVKNNFYFLWEISEEIKKHFFKGTQIFTSKFAQKSINNDELNDIILNKWQVFVSKNNQFQAITDFPDIVFNIREISKLIKGDIYFLTKKFLEKYYYSGDINFFSIIKLTGQSCRIEVFKEVVKEFIPGKRIEVKQSKSLQERENYSLELKFACLKGVIRYLRSKNFGDIIVDIKNEVPIIPYSVEARSAAKREVIFNNQVDEREIAFGSVFRPYSTTTVELFLINRENGKQKKYVFFNDIDKYKLSTAEDISMRYDRISQYDTDDINNDITKFFIYVDERCWGIFVLPVMRQNDQLYLGELAYYPFEDNVSIQTFFEGDR